MELQQLLEELLGRDWAGRAGERAPGLWKSECQSGICSSPTVLALPCDSSQMGEGLGWTWAILGFCISTRETRQFRERRT